MCTFVILPQIMSLVGNTFSEYLTFKNAWNVTPLSIFTTVTIWSSHKLTLRAASVGFVVHGWSPKQDAISPTPHYFWTQIRICHSWSVTGVRFLSTGLNKTHPLLLVSLLFGEKCHRKIVSLSHFKEILSDVTACRPLEGIENLRPISCWDMRNLLITFPHNKTCFIWRTWFNQSTHSSQVNLSKWI